MPRIHVRLPASLYREVKQRNIDVSALLQAAVAEEVRRLELGTALDAYLDELLTEVGEPTADEQAWAEAVTLRIARHELGDLAGLVDEMEADGGPVDEANVSRYMSDMQ